VARDYAQMIPMPPVKLETVKCQREGCGGLYLDNDDGKRAHTVVFGHWPSADVAAADLDYEDW
jgi:hypothetical protein